MNAEMRAEFERNNTDRAACGEPLISEQDFVFVWQLDEQWIEWRATHPLSQWGREPVFIDHSDPLCP